MTPIEFVSRNQLVSLYEGDNRDVLKVLIAEGVRVHAVVTDPPYHLESVVARFGKTGSAAAQAGSDGRFARQSKGFMGRAWDGAQGDYRIAQDPDFWNLVRQILLPGGYVLGFASPRTGHRQAVAMETAGFIIHPFFGWVYAQGFPKAHSAAKAGGKWEGWFYGAQSCKPALEPIYVAQSPFEGKSQIANLLRHGVGAMNIDACRLEGGEGQGREGRWPANLLHDGSPEVLAQFPEAPGQAGRTSTANRVANKNVYGDMIRGGGEASAPRSDSGSAARFFNSFPVVYHAKATAADRAGSTHPTVKPVELLQWLCRLVTPPGGIVLDPFAGSGTLGTAATLEGFDAILIEREPDYCADIIRRFVGGAPSVPTRAVHADVLDLI